MKRIAILWNEDTDENSLYVESLKIVLNDEEKEDYQTEIYYNQNELLKDFKPLFNADMLIVLAELKWDGAYPAHFYGIDLLLKLRLEYGLISPAIVVSAFEKELVKMVRYQNLGVFEFDMNTTSSFFSLIHFKEHYTINQMIENPVLTKQNNERLFSWFFKYEKAIESNYEKLNDRHCPCFHFIYPKIWTKTLALKSTIQSEIENQSEYSLLLDQFIPVYNFFIALFNNISVDKLMKLDKPAIITLGEEEFTAILQEMRIIYDKMEYKYG